MINALFIISPRGDCILQRTFRKQHAKNIVETFLKQLKVSADGPVIQLEDSDTTCCYINRGGLNYVFTMASVDVPLSVCCDLLESLVGVIKDMCGVLDEENLRKNFLLLNEIVDEMFDYGIPIAHDTQQLTVALCSNGSIGSAFNKSPTAGRRPGAGGGLSLGNRSAAFGRGGQGQGSSILSDNWARDMFSSETMSKLTSSFGLPIAGDGGGVFDLTHHSAAPRTIPSHASQLPVGKNTSAELFVDIKDRVSADVSVWDGRLLRGSLEGCIVVKSYMDDFPMLRMGLNEDLSVANPYAGVGEAEEPATLKAAAASGLVLDDCVFEESVNSSELTSQKCLSFCPKKGEFVLMKYRAQKFSLPFTIVAKCEVINEKVEVTANLTSNSLIGREISGIITVSNKLPVWATSVSVAKTCYSSGAGGPAKKQQQKVSYSAAERVVTWQNKSLEGDGPPTGFAMRFEVNRERAPRPLLEAMTRFDGRFVARYLAPFQVSFDLPMYSSSRLQVRNPSPRTHLSQIRYIRCHAGAAPPQRWVRYVTQSDSFVGTFQA